MSMESFTCTAIVESAETMGNPLVILKRFINNIKQFHTDGKFGAYALMPPDTANIKSIVAIVSDEITVEVKPKEQGE